MCLDGIGHHTLHNFTGNRGSDILCRLGFVHVGACMANDNNFTINGSIDMVLHGLFFRARGTIQL